MAAAAVLVARSEYDARTAAGERIEYDQGLILPIANNDSEHDGIKIELSDMLSHQIPRSFRVATEVTFEVAPDRVRHPDIGVLLSRPKLVRGQRFQGAPALAIEIVSANDVMTDVEDKIELYLAHDAAAVWVIFPIQRKIRIHRPNHAVRELVPGDILTGEPPIPMFELNVAELFA